MANASPLPRRQRSQGFGGDVSSSNLDLVLAVLVSFGLPLGASWLYDATGGATAGLLLYYAVCCVGLVLWRKGTLDYRRPERWPWGIFLGGLAVAAAIATIGWLTNVPVNAPPLGVALTALLWAPLNGAMEQLAWFYVFDAWRNRWSGGTLRLAGIAVGTLLLLVVVSLIHILFWVKFLPGDGGGPLTAVTITLNSGLTLFYGLLYYRSRSWWPTMVLHTLVDLQLVLIPLYSILPYL